jgi:hypothetical protein
MSESLCMSIAMLRMLTLAAIASKGSCAANFRKFF